MGGYSRIQPRKSAAAEEVPALQLQAPGTRALNKKELQLSQFEAENQRAQPVARLEVKKKARLQAQVSTYLKPTPSCPDLV